MEIDLPSHYAEFLKVVFNNFNTEIIDDKLFIKYDNMTKEDIHFELKNLLKQQLTEWKFSINMICVVIRNTYKLDVGRWLIFPMIYTNNPDDCDYALNKIKSLLSVLCIRGYELKQRYTTCDFLFRKRF
ncbi:hypothetical protein RhiirB3_389040 [Rhizophagus irregularis]|nr:hypothetical protein RhiirB3_389040 [Rhizophagus irregularis]